MSEFSGFWTTTGAPAGDQQASYTQAQWSTATAVMTATHGFEGVAYYYENSLQATVTGANTVRVQTGGAIVDGKYYKNSANVDVNIPSAVGGGNTRIDRIVLRCSWAGFTVRITRIAGVDAASPAAPAITQTPGTTYDIMLYQALVDTGGTVTITDERVFGMIRTGAIYDANVTQGKLALGASKVTNRQGNSATNWGTAGTNNYVPTTARIQTGVISWAGGAISGASAALTFPVAYSFTPVVLATVQIMAAPADWGLIVEVESLTASGCSLTWMDMNGANHTSVTINWLAIGPE